MQVFKDRVAVITGAGSGIGRAFALHCAAEGMKVVLAGIKTETLLPVQQALEAQGASTLVVQTDVAQPEDVERLAQQTIDHFGGVHLLFNNAGVTTLGYMWEHTLEDWEWVMGVNIRGVIHGIKYFVPIMLEQNTEAHIINNASFMAFAAAYNLGSIYAMTKRAVVSLSESLYYELAHVNPQIKVSVLAASYVKSDIMQAGRNRPEILKNDAEQTGPEIDRMRQMRLDSHRHAMPVDQFIDLTFDAIRADKLYIFSHPELMPILEDYFDNVLAARNPKTP
ncbi:MAG: 3-oxoacyl-ACP reductase [Anaerolineaceae bacterium]|nr:3-oxoacyl-ACP reductase [Anaerolineaceae bacterium]